MNEQALTAQFGTILTTTGAHLNDVDGQAVLMRLKVSGVVVLRGFSGDTQAFEAFTRTVASRFIHNGNDRRLDLGDAGRTRSVTPGQGFVGPHSEFAYTPARPDVLFFYCSRPALAGGASLLWDGRRVWDDMPAHLRQYFVNRRVKYTYSGIELGFFAQFAGCNGSSAIRAFLDRQPGVSYQVRGEIIDVAYCTFAQRPDRFGGQVAFANSIAVDGRTVFEDGEILPALARTELLAHMLGHTLSVPAQCGDVIVIDNTRVMHGRTAFADPQRLICSRMGFFDQPAH